MRFNELRHLQTVDFSRNPHAPEFGRYGVVKVRGRIRRPRRSPAQPAAAPRTAPPTR
ncbi:hypothetical protein ABIA65_003020 [Mycolicibacterium sp. 624]